MKPGLGQIALKLMSFETAVTVLAGLPSAITTPAHGTAFDIAGKGSANLMSLRSWQDMSGLIED